MTCGLPFFDPIYSWFLEYCKEFWRAVILTVTLMWHFSSTQSTRWFLRSCNEFWWVVSVNGYTDILRSTLFRPVWLPALRRFVAVDFSACPDPSLQYCLVQSYFTDPATVPDLSQEPCHCIDVAAMDAAFGNPPKKGECVRYVYRLYIANDSVHVSSFPVVSLRESDYSTALWNVKILLFSFRTAVATVHWSDHYHPPPHPRTPSLNPYPPPPFFPSFV